MEAVSLEEIKLFFWRRGYQIDECCQKERIILPKDLSLEGDYFNFLSHYRFRRLLSDIIHSQDNGRVNLEKLFSRWNLEEIREYWEFLVKSGILPLVNENYYFSYPYIDNFGETLEWYISGLLVKEFKMPTVWGVKIRELKGGGDFDVLSILEGYLLYIECKTSPPNNVRLREIWEFLRRREELKPKITILFIDTTLKIERNITENVKYLLDKRFAKDKNNVLLKLKEGIYAFDKSLYIMQSKGEMVKNFQLVFRDFLNG
ncbi:MAG: hypothetical protein ACPLSN_02655 [Dictyoglomus turgidum]